MSFRFPVSTQEPIEVSNRTQDYERRVYRDIYRDINGNVAYRRYVPAGVKWRVVGILIITDVAQPSANDCRVDVQIKSAVDDGSGNVIYRTLLPDMTNQHQYVNLTPTGAYATYDVTKGSGALTYRMAALPTPDMLLLPNESIQVDAYSFGANDDLAIYVAVEEYV